MGALCITWRKLATQIQKSRPVSNARKFFHVAFSDKYLIFTNITISISLSSLGDVIEQKYEIYMGNLERLDLKRTAQMGFSGMAVGALCHHWYKILDRFIVGKSAGMVAKKLILDQFIFSPIMIITFFGSLALLEEDPIRNFKEEVSEKFVRLYKAEWMVWPPAQIINFYFLPTKYRVLYDNVISLGYDVYSSQVRHEKHSTVNITKQ